MSNTTEREARVHELKTDPEAFDAVASGAKTFEIRRDDRGFEVGDTLVLRRTMHTGLQMGDGSPLVYTGEQVERKVSHILRGPLYGLAHGWAILSLAATPAQPPSPPPPAILADSLEDVIHQPSSVVRRARATPAQPVAPLPPIVKVLAEWEDKNGSLAGILPSEWSGLWRDVTTAAVEQSPRQLRAALAASQPKDDHD